jgi:tetratricopeptide (TPR) repeat protein
MSQHQLAIESHEANQGVTLLSIAALYERCLETFTETNEPEQWARVNGLLGGLFSKIPTGDCETDSARATAYYEIALRVFTEEVFPAQWAATQSLLGGVYLRWSIGDRRGHLLKAVAHFDAALRVWSEARTPREWATNHANLGSACRALATLSSGTYLYRAVDCYRSALRIFTRESFPIEWAGIQRNLANAYQDLPANEQCNAQQAIQCAEESLTVFTRSAYPAEWAMSQAAMARSYAKASNDYKMAIRCCKAALTVFRKPEFPYEWALTQTILGISLASVTETEGADHLEQALSCFDASLSVYREESHPSEWAHAQFSYGTALTRRLGAGREANLDQAIACFESALRVWSEQLYSADWARATINLGTAHVALASSRKNAHDDRRRQSLQAGVACYQAALRVVTQNAFPVEWAAIQNNLPSALAELASGRSQDEHDATTTSAQLRQASPARVLFLRPFWDSDVTAEQLETLAGSLHEIAFLVALRNGREGRRRWWWPNRSRERILLDHVRLVSSSRRRWQGDVLNEIVQCDAVVLHLAAKELERVLPPITTSSFIRDFGKLFVSDPVHESGVGHGLLRELTYCRQASVLDRTIVVVPAAFRARVAEILEVLSHTTDGLRLYLVNEQGLVPTLPRMIAADRGLAVLQHVHAVIAYDQFGDRVFNEALRGELVACLSTPATPGPRRLLIGIPDRPIALPPDWVLKWIRFTRLELLTQIPPMEIVELSVREVRRCRPEALAYFQVCRGCGHGRGTMFFYQHGLTPNLKRGASVRMDCQYCGFRDYYA